MRYITNLVGKVKKLVLSWTVSSSHSSTFVMELFLITTGISTNKFSYVNLLSRNISAVNSLSSLYSLNAATDSLNARILRFPSFVFSGSEEQDQITIGLQDICFRYI